MGSTPNSSRLASMKSTISCVGGRLLLKSVACLIWADDRDAKLAGGIVTGVGGVWGGGCHPLHGFGDVDREFGAVGFGVLAELDDLGVVSEHPPEPWRVSSKLAGWPDVILV